MSVDTKLYYVYEEGMGDTELACDYQRQQCD